VRPTYFVYILSSARRILYVGVTRDLVRRLAEHRTRFHRRCFTARYNVFALVHVESFPTPSSAIARER
jgi:putative endonuclease